MTAGALAAVFLTLATLRAELSQNDKRERDVHKLRTRRESSVALHQIAGFYL